MKVIFLDCDGVMNNWPYIKQMGAKFDLPENQMDPVAVARLNKLTDATGAKLVISSTWRIHFVDANRLDLMQECMASYGITGEVIGMTPIDIFGSITSSVIAIGNRRGNEILAWIEDHYKEIDRFVIVDDDSDMGKVRKFLVKTHLDDGLQDHHLVKMTEILESEDDWRPVVENTPMEMF